MMGQAGSTARQALGTYLFRVTQDDRHQHDLDGGDGHADRVHVDDGAQAELADERRHEDAADGGRGQGTESATSPRAICAQVGGLTAVYATHEDETRAGDRISPPCFPRAWQSRAS